MATQVERIREGFCPTRSDEQHCVHWWDAGPCCSCFAGRACIDAHSCSSGCEAEDDRQVSCCYTGACDCCALVIVDGKKKMDCQCLADDCVCIHGYAAENYD